MEVKLNEIINKIGKVEQLELLPAEEFAEVPDETLAEWINTGHSAIKMAVRRLAIHVAQVGAWLTTAKSKCQHGEWLDWLSENCPEMAVRTVQHYMQFYDKVISNTQILAHLAEMSVVEGYRAVGVVKNPTDKLEVETPPLPEGKYNVIYADPPWRYDFSPTDSRKIENQYPTMSLENIKELADRDDWPVADNAVLFLWGTTPKLRESLEVMEYWEFDYKTNAVWDKEIIGTGFWWRGQHELLLTGVKGSFSPPSEETRISSVIRHKREDHSRKPRLVYGIIEKMFPKGKGIELFSRDKYSDYWKVWGYEAYVN
jgi:N6-adenosine-specific RNA methylase IME4